MIPWRIKYSQAINQSPVPPLDRKTERRVASPGLAWPTRVTVPVEPAPVTGGWSVTWCAFIPQCEGNNQSPENLS